MGVAGINPGHFCIMGSAGSVMMIDARNCMYRAVCAARSDYERNQLAGTRKQRKHSFPIMLRLISSWVRELKPSTVQVFWDAPRASVWRRELYEGYKDRDDQRNTNDGTVDDLMLTESVAVEMFEHLNVRQFKKDRMEADDLIYAACRVQCTKDIVVCSSDTDMLQLLYIVPKAKIFNPDKGGLITEAAHNPVWHKALVGDKSDKIPGYDGIGPKTAAKILDDPSKFHALMEERGKETMVRNLKLIDLSMSPYTLQNQIYVGKALAAKVQYDKAELTRLAAHHKLGMVYDMAELTAPFRNLI